jgi:hypothetical protein
MKMRSLLWLLLPLIDLTLSTRRLAAKTLRRRSRTAQEVLLLRGIGRQAKRESRALRR